MAHSTDRGFNPRQTEGRWGKWLGLGIESNLRGDREASQGFLYTWELSLNLRPKYKIVNEVQNSKGDTSYPRTATGQRSGINIVRSR